LHFEKEKLDASKDDADEDCRKAIADPPRSRRPWEKDSKALYARVHGHEDSKHVTGEHGRSKSSSRTHNELRMWGLYRDRKNQQKVHLTEKWKPLGL
jgi:hypothetical protein